MGITNYDYAIIGAGAAGLNLAITIANHSFFKDKEVVIVDSDHKNVNDKTWCFWSDEITSVDKIISKKWDTAIFTNRKGEKHKLELAPFTYNMIHSIDFYDHAKEELNKHNNVHWLQSKVIDVLEDDAGIQIITDKNSLRVAEHVFDSRISEQFQSDTLSTKLLQHFKGWVIETEQDHFDDSSFVMMDFSLIWKDTTSFTYVLPYSPKKALIEFTFFSPALVNDEDYDQMIQKYIMNHLGINSYSVSAVEQGVIPMSDYRFEQHNTTQVTKIGTAGGWVKPSSGYSFHNALKLSKQLTKNIVNGERPSKGLLNSKFRFYDSVFLDVLFSNNHKGPDLFADMYQKNSVTKIFKFLNEETTLPEEIKIMSSFPMGMFNTALFRKLF